MFFQMNKKAQAAETILNVVLLFLLGIMFLVLIVFYSFSWTETQTLDEGIESQLDPHNMMQSFLIANNFQVEQALAISKDDVTSDALKLISLYDSATSNNLCMRLYDEQSGIKTSELNSDSCKINQKVTFLKDADTKIQITFGVNYLE